MKRDHGEGLQDNSGPQKPDDGWIRHSFTLPMAQARIKVSELLKRYPKAGYETQVEKWKVLSSGNVEFTIKHKRMDD